jgi:hypothetical protein
MIKTSKFTLDPGETDPVCKHCYTFIKEELAETSARAGYFHLWCAQEIESDCDPSDYMAFMLEARDYAKSKGE